MKSILYPCAFMLISIGVFSCENKTNAPTSLIPEFPYQVFLDSMSPDESFPNIGDDGNGFAAISHKISYIELPDSLSLSHFADSLLLFYNTSIAFNTIAYDVSTAERYLEEPDFGLSQADALDSVNLSGIKDPAIRDALLTTSRDAAQWIRKGKRPNEQDIESVHIFYETYNKFCDAFLENHMTDEKFNPSTIVPEYPELHAKALMDTLEFRSTLLQMVLKESDFQKACVLAREFAYANRKNPSGNDKELVAVIDKLLCANRYSPLLGELWLMWRTALQTNIFGSRSNDGAMYNLFYNQMKNRIALQYIAHLKTHPQDRVAFNLFAKLAMEYNITRNSNCIFGNNANLDDMELYFHNDN